MSDINCGVIELLENDEAVDLEVDDPVIELVEEEGVETLAGESGDITDIYAELDDAVDLLHSETVVDLLDVPIGVGGVTINTIEDAVLTLTAGENLGGQRVVYVSGGEAFLADHTEVAHIGKIIGLTAGAANIGNPVNVITFGDVTDNGWSWVPGPLWLNTNGTMTQTRPVTGFVQRVAKAISPTKISIDIDEPVKLAS